jgi:hypothetical protein
MVEPEPLPSGNLQPPRVPPRVGTATADRGRPHSSGSVPPSRRWITWRLISTTVLLTASCVALLGYGVWKQPIAAGCSIVAAAFLIWRRARQGSAEFHLPNRVMMYGTLLAGVLGELLTQVVHPTSTAGIGWVLLYSVAIGSVIGLGMGWGTWLLGLLGSMWSLLRESHPRWRS